MEGLKNDDRIPKEIAIAIRKGAKRAHRKRIRERGKSLPLVKRGSWKAWNALPYNKRPLLYEGTGALPTLSIEFIKKTINYYNTVYKDHKEFPTIIKLALYELDCIPETVTNALKQSKAFIQRLYACNLSQKQALLDEYRLDEDGAKWVERFVDTLKKIERLSETRLQELCLTKNVPSGPIFLLKCNHGYIETSRQVIEGEVIHRPIDNIPLKERIKKLEDERRLLESGKSLSYSTE